MKSKIALLLLLLITSTQAISYTYFATINNDAKNSIVVDNNNIVSEKPIFSYLSKFNLDAIGFGNYTGDDYVHLPNMSSISKPTNIIDTTEYKEVRVKFQSFGSNYANAIQILNANTQQLLLQWYNFDNNFYIPYSNTFIKIDIEYNPTSSDILEIRFNLETKVLSFYANGNIIYSQINNNINFSDQVYLVIFEGSTSSTPTKLFPN